MRKLSAGQAPWCGGWQVRQRVGARLGAFGGGGDRGNPLYRHDQTIAAARYGFNILGLASGVTERLAQLADGSIDGLVELHGCVVGPESFADLLAGGHLAAKFHQHPQNPERLLLEHDPAPALVQLSGFEVEVKGSEPRAVGSRDCHGCAPVCR